MRLFKQIGGFLLLTLLLLASCNSDKESDEKNQASPRIKKASKLISPPANAEFILGDAVSFKVESTAPVDSIKLVYAGETTIYKTPEFVWKAEQGRTGTQKLKLFVYSGGRQETHYPRVKFLSDSSPEAYTYEVIKTYDHDTEAFTQGLFFIGDTLVESTGGKGTSTLSKLNLNTLEVYKSVSLSSNYFGEGSTVWKDQIIQLTWTTETGFVYDFDLNETATFNYPHEGWGITTYGDTLIVSDGTETLHLLDPRDFSEIGKLEVYTDEREVKNLNELEMINGVLYANVWLQDLIVSIDPKSGKVLAQIDMSGLRDTFDENDVEAFNGIAYKAETNQIYVTGKLWPKLFEVKFIPK